MDKFSIEARNQSKRLLRFCLLGAAFSIPSNAAERVWTGAVSESFSGAGNWAGFEVPTALDTVVHSNSAGVKRIRVDMDAEIDSLVVIGGGGRAMVIDDDRSLVVRKGITNRVSAEYSLTVRPVGNLFIGGEVGANVSVDRMRDRIPFDLLAKRAAERQAVRESLKTATFDAERDAAWRGLVDDAGATLANRKLHEGVKYIGGVPEGGDGVADVFYIDREGGKRVKATVIARTGDPAPGLPGTFFGIFNAPSMRSDGEQAVIHSILVGAINGDSVWRWTRDEGMEIVAHVGQQAAGMAPGVTYSWLSNRRIDDSGAVAFVGYVSGPGIIGGVNDDAVWYGQPDDLQVVVQGGMAVPGGEPGVMIDSGFPFTITSLSRDGNLLIYQEAVHPRYESAWVTLKSRQGGPLETVGVTGQPVAALPGAEVLLISDAKAALGDNGELFRMTVIGDGIDGSNDSGSWMSRFGILSPFQHEGFPAPGMGDPKITVRTGNVVPQINGLGHSAHSFRIQGPGIDESNEDVMAGSALKDFAIFAQQGDPMIDGPPGIFFGVLGLSGIDMAGIIHFRAGLTGAVDDSNDLALCLGSHKDPALFIRSGDQTPDGAEGEEFSLQPTTGFAKIARNEFQQMAISAHTKPVGEQEFHSAVWLIDISDSNWTRLFSEGETWDTFEVPSSDSGAYFFATTGTSGSSIGLSDDGTLGVDLDFTDFNDGVYAIQQINLGDSDEDGDVDLVDFSAFQLCFTGPGVEASVPCSVAFDFDGDGDVDLADFGGFQLQFTGAR